MSVPQSRLSGSSGLHSNTVQRFSIVCAPPANGSSIQNRTRTPPVQVKTEKADTPPSEQAPFCPVWQTTSLTTFRDFYKEMGVNNSQMQAFDVILQKWLFARDKPENATHGHKPKAISTAEYRAFFLPSLQHEIMRETNRIKKRTILSKYKTAKESEVDLWLIMVWIIYIDRRVEHIRKSWKYRMARRQNDPVRSPRLKYQEQCPRPPHDKPPAPKRTCHNPNPDNEIKLEPASRKISNKSLFPPKESTSTTSVIDKEVALAAPSSKSSKNSKSSRAASSTESSKKSKSSATMEQSLSSQTSSTFGSSSRKRSHSPEIDHSEPPDQISSTRSPKRRQRSQSLDPVTRGILDTLWDNQKLDSEILLEYLIQKGVERQLQQ